MDAFWDALKFVLPAITVLVGMYLVVVENNKRKEAKEMAEIRSKTLATLFPLRLQAYERVVLLLERISPENLVIRADGKGKTAKVFHLQLIMEIRAEFEHNMSQQLYMDSDSWVEVVKAKESILALVNRSLAQLPPDASGLDLSKQILDSLLAMEASPCHVAIREVKYDIQRYFTPKSA